MSRIPVSVVIVTKNEEKTLGRCLAALSDFGEVVVVDSASTDHTKDIARQAGARVFNFEWNGRYPKKRQWCLETLDLAYDWIFFLDADEEMTPALVAEIAGLNFSCAGYFVKGRYVYDGRVLRHGLVNNKLVLFDRRKIEFPVVDDLDIAGMGEMEGHYQPVLKPAFVNEVLCQVRTPLLHHAYEVPGRWQERHVRYAVWERGMNQRRAWPRDPVAGREAMKRLFRVLPGRGLAAFVHCYIFKCGLLDGRRGLQFAADRYKYYTASKI